VDSIRNPAEVESLKRRKDFALIEVTASEKIRFERIKARGREGDPQTLEKFRTLEAQEESQHKSQQQLTETAGFADTVVENNDTVEALHHKILLVVQNISRTAYRPDWDEYFMSIAKTVALRSNCIKRKVAAVIVKDKRLISTGYNGTPRGVQNCNEGGCLRCNSMTASGKDLETCICSHAEENSITQAAYHGVSVKDSLIYVTLSPCLTCAKMMINAGVREVIYNQHYVIGDASLSVLKKAGIRVRAIEMGSVSDREANSERLVRV